MIMYMYPYVTLFIYRFSFLFFQRSCTAKAVELGGAPFKGFLIAAIDLQSNKRIGSWVKVKGVYFILSLLTFILTFSTAITTEIRIRAHESDLLSWSFMFSKEYFLEEEKQC